MTARRPVSAATAAGSSAGASHTPTSPRAMSAARRSIHSASGTMTGTPSGRSARTVASRTTVQRSSVTTRCLMSCDIDALLERLEADALHGVDESLVVVAVRDVRIDEPLHDVRHLVRGKRGADDLAERGGVALRAADGDLVPLRAVLVDAEDADVADVVLSARIHAARHVEVDLA